MKVLAAILCLSAISFAAHAQQHIAKIDVQRGQIELKNQDGDLIKISSENLKVAIEEPKFFTDLIRLVKMEKVLKIRSAGQEFSFRIPKNLITSYGNFSVRMDYAEQNAHVQSAVLKYDETKSEEEKAVGCSYYRMRMVDGSVKNELMWGSQKARVLVSHWTQQLKIKIYNNQGYLEMTTEPTDESKDLETLKTLTACY